MPKPETVKVKALKKFHMGSLEEIAEPGKVYELEIEDAANAVAAKRATYDQNAKAEKQVEPAKYYESPTPPNPEPKK